MKVSELVLNKLVKHIFQHPRIFLINGEQWNVKFQLHYKILLRIGSQKIVEYSLQTNKWLSRVFLLIYKSGELIYRRSCERPPRPAANLDRWSISIYFMSWHLLYGIVLRKISPYLNLIFLGILAKHKTRE